MQGINTRMNRTVLPAILILSNCYGPAAGGGGSPGPARAVQPPPAPIVAEVDHVRERPVSAGAASNIRRTRSSSPANASGS